MSLAHPTQAFRDADIEWFKANPDRTFRYHLLSDAEMNAVVPDAHVVTLAGYTLVVAYVPRIMPDSVAYFYPDLDAEQARLRYEIAGSEDDRLGLWLVFSRKTIPRVPWATIIERGEGVQAIISSLTKGSAA